MSGGGCVRRQTVTPAASVSATRIAFTAIPRAAYRESLVLRDGVSVVSARRRSAELRRPPAAGGGWTAVAAVGAASGVLRGFRIVGTDAEPLAVGVHLRDGSLSIEDVEIVGASDVRRTAQR
jgi:hypothetical protein